MRSRYLKAEERNGIALQVARRQELSARLKGIVLYRGEPCTEDGVVYENVSDYLFSLG